MVTAYYVAVHLQVVGTRHDWHSVHGFRENYGVHPAASDVLPGTRKAPPLYQERGAVRSDYLSIGR